MPSPCSFSTAYTTAGVCAYVCVCVWVWERRTQVTKYTNQLKIIIVEHQSNRILCFPANRLRNTNHNEHQRWQQQQQQQQQRQRQKKKSRCWSHKLRNTNREKQIKLKEWPKDIPKIFYALTNHYSKQLENCTGRNYHGEGRREGIGEDRGHHVNATSMAWPGNWWDAENRSRFHWQELIKTFIYRPAKQAPLMFGKPSLWQTSVSVYEPQSGWW